MTIFGRYLYSFFLWCFESFEKIAKFNAIYYLLLKGFYMNKLAQPVSFLLFFCLAGWVMPVHAYKEVNVSNGGTIEGKVTFTGRVKKRTIIPTKDKSVCGGMRKVPLIIVGPDKGVKDSIVYLRKVKKGKAWPKQETIPVLDQKGCRFAPNVQVIRKGKLAIVNSDPVLHNTHGYLCKKLGKSCKRTAFNLALPNQNQRVEKNLKRAGTVKVDCDAHGWMLGWMQVVDNPYYAITGTDGMFTMTDVPPGKYTLVAFQGYTGGLEIPLTVKANELVKVNAQLKK